MNRHHKLSLLACLLLLIATGCEQQSIAEQEQIKTRQTLEATTPSATPTHTATPAPTATSGPSPTAAPTSTVAPSPTASPTALPTVTPLPPTPTPNPALAGFSLCSQLAGSADGGRFSARITAITTTVQTAFERVTIGLATPGDSAPPHALASCVSTGDTAGPAYSLQIRLAGWLHDDAFKATTISSTVALSGTALIKSLELRADASAPAGATLALGLAQPLPYRLRLEKDPYRLVLDIAKTGAVGANNDMLAQAAGAVPQPAAPLLYLQGGDIWKFADGKASNLTNATRAGQFGDVSALAASAASGQVAFCAVAPGTDAGDRVAPRTLWLTDFSGKEPQVLAQQNLWCDDPAFSPDGKTIAFTADETGATPPRLSIWTVGAAGGAELRLSPPGDEWSRFAPQWLDNQRLVYAAQAEDGRSSLFVHTADGSERDIGADLLKGDTHSGLGRPLAAPNGAAIAVEALRTAGGADLLLIGPDGAPLANQSPIAEGYWSRPLAWSSDGTLFYLTSACESTIAQSYTLRARALTGGDDRTIAVGTTLGGFGDVRAVGKGLAYVVLQRAADGPRGPLAASPAGPSTLWFWDVGGAGGRAQLAAADSAIGRLAP
ncbi:MAG: hypothetical protein U0Z44_04275 [Kouleothrix sp.]